MSGDRDDREPHGFFQELIRRRIFRSAGAYIVASWVLVQVASIAFPEFDAPRWAMRALIIMLVAGFPFAMLLAWTLDVTTSGIVRTKHTYYSKQRENLLRGSILAVATLISAGALWWLWTDYVQPTSERAVRAPIKPNPIVAVSTPRMLSGSVDNIWLGEGLANLIRNDLAESPNVVVLSAAGWNRVAGDIDSHEEISRLARNAGIDYLVAGEYLETTNGIVLTLSIEDLENEIVIQGPRIDEIDTAGIFSATDEMFVGVRQALRIPLEENVKRFSADFTTQNMNAYEAYVAGLGFFINFDYQKAEQAFRAAVELAPDYHMARLKLAEVLEAEGRSELAYQELEQIGEDAELTDREQLYVDGAKASFIVKRDVDHAIEIYRELFDRYPYDMEAGQLLAEAYWLAFDEPAAIDVFRQLAEVHSYDPSAWMALGERLLDVGELDEAGEAIARYVDTEPVDPYAHALLGNLALLRGELQVAIDAYQQSLDIKPSFVIATLGLSRARYIEGDAEAAEELWRSLINNADAAAQHRIDAAFDLAGVLRGQQRFAEAIDTLESIEAPIREEGLYTATMLSTLGLLHLELNDSETASTLIQQAIEESPSVATRHLFARGLLELRSGAMNAARATADEIRALALPPDDPDRTEDKAADYLLGLVALELGDLNAAGSSFESALQHDGYEYTLYGLGQVQYLARLGETQAAADLAERVSSTRDPGDLRLDLELDRAIASRLHGDLLASLSN